MPKIPIWDRNDRFHFSDSGWNLEIEKCPYEKSESCVSLSMCALISSSVKNPVMRTQIPIQFKRNSLFFFFRNEKCWFDRLKANFFFKISFFSFSLVGKTSFSKFLTIEFIATHPHTAGLWIDPYWKIWLLQKA